MNTTLWEPASETDARSKTGRVARKTDQHSAKDNTKRGAQHPYRRALAKFVPWLLSVVFGLSTIFLATRTHVQIAGDMNGIAPIFKQQLVTFQPKRSFVANLTNAGFKNSTRPIWLDLVPKGFGFLRIDEPEQYNDLPPPYHRHSHNLYMTSITHQSMCVKIIVTCMLGWRMWLWIIGHAFEFADFLVRR